MRIACWLDLIRERGTWKPPNASATLVKLFSWMKPMGRGAISRFEIAMNRCRDWNA